MRGTALLVVLMQLTSLAFAITPEDCEDSEYHIDPDNCPFGYFRCYKDANGEWSIEEETCPDGTGFNPAIQSCDWIDNLPSDICDGLTTANPPPTTDAADTTTTDVAPTTNPSGKRVVCYFGAWAYYRPRNSFDIDNIDPFLCTHLCYGFANMHNDTWEAYAYDPWYDLAPWDEGCDTDHCKYDSYRRFNALKSINPALKTLISIGGWNSGSQQWSEMAIDPARRNIFITSAVKMVKTFDFDGVDFDWEYPGDREGADEVHDKEDFSLVIEELGAALHAEGKILTAATSPDHARLDKGYDLTRVLKAMDFINVMDYDYHGGWDDFTGHNTPLYGRADERQEGHPGYLFNVNDTINYYLDHGANPDQLNLGTASYGRGFILESPDNNGIYCPSVAALPKGPNTNETGMWSYVEIREAISNTSLPVLPDAVPGQWTEVRDGCYKAPYIYNGPYWIGYDDKESIALKAKYANYRELGGIMMFGLDLDDFNGVLGGEKYPLTNVVKSIMESGEILDPEDILGENSECETAPSCDM